MFAGIKHNIRQDNPLKPNNAITGQLNPFRQAPAQDSNQDTLAAAEESDAYGWPTMPDFPPDFKKPTASPGMPYTNGNSAPTQPMPGYFHPTGYQPGQPMGHSSGKTGIAEPAKKGKGLLSWHRKGKDKSKPVDPEKIVQVGPKETQPSPNPLLRLPMAVRLPTSHILPAASAMHDAVGSPSADNAQSVENNRHSTSSIPPGFYLLKPLRSTPDELVMGLMQRDKQVAVCVLRRVGLSNAEARTPLTRKKGSAPPPVKVDTILSADRKQLTVRLTQEGNRFESDALPVAAP